MRHLWRGNGGVWHGERRSPDAESVNVGYRMNLIVPRSLAERFHHARVLSSLVVAGGDSGGGGRDVGGRAADDAGFAAAAYRHRCVAWV